MYYERGGVCLDNVTLPARLVTRNRLRPRHHGLIPVHLAKCLFLLSLPFLCVAYSCAVVDKKDHTAGAIQVPSHEIQLSSIHVCKIGLKIIKKLNSLRACSDLYAHAEHTGQELARTLSLRVRN